MIEVYCDGACSGNPGAGAWAYLALDTVNDVFFASGSSPCLETTNNRMELTACIQALQVFDNCDVIVDSKYVQLGITSWSKKWVSNGWKTASGVVKNVDLWQQLIALNDKRNINWRWQKGHYNNMHDYVDVLARHSVLGVK